MAELRQNSMEMRRESDNAVVMGVVRGQSLRYANVILAVMALAVASAAAAQDAASAKKKPADSATTQDASDAKKKPADSSAPAQPGAPQSGPDTTTETFGDWSLVCSARPGTDRSCEVSTAIMLPNQAAPFARIAILRGVKDKPDHVLALVPVNVSVQAPVKITADTTEISLTLRSCVPGGCLADAELGKDLLQTLKTPVKGQGQITVINAGGKPAPVAFSMRGLDAALEAYFKQ
jgi:invasion protein IalB